GRKGGNVRVGFPSCLSCPSRPFCLPWPWCLHWNLYRLSAPLRDLRDGDAEFAARESRMGARRVARAAETYGPRKTPERALDEMKARFAVAAVRTLLARHEHRVALHHHAKRRWGHAGQVGRDFDGFVGFEDVNRRGAFAGQ